MPNSGVVDQLTAHRGLASLPGVWVELAYGRLSTKEAVRLARPQEDGELAERTARMLAPPTAAQSQARLQDLLEQWSTSSTVPEPSATPSSGRWILGVVTLAAAAVLLVVMPRIQPGVGAFDAGYQLELDRALAVQHEAAGGEDVLRYRLDHSIQFTVRPAHRVLEGVGARVFAMRADGRAVTVSTRPRIGELGVVEVEGRPRAWGLDAGRWQLMVVVGPPTGLPASAQDVRMESDVPYDVVQVWIEVLEDPI